jgi:hypothetical protein
MKPNKAAVAAALLIACTPLITFPSSAAAVPAAQMASYYNALRTANGIPGDLTVDQPGSANCALHNHYAALNGNDYPNPHQETPGKQGYTDGGNWAASHSELAGGSGFESAFAPFDDGNPEWTAPFVGAPFHLMGLLDPSSTTLWGADSEGGLCIGEGHGRPNPAVDTLYSFPGNGSSVAWAEPYPNEYPTSPEAVAGIATGSVTGPVLTVYWRGPSDADNPTLDVLSAGSVTGPSGPVAVDVVSSQQSSLIGSGNGFVIPTAPLTPGLSYTATVTFSTAPGAATPRSWTQSFTFTAAGPPPAASLVHLDAVLQPHSTLLFVTTADFPAAQQPVTVTVAASNPLIRYTGGTGVLSGAPGETAYPVHAPEPGGWVRETLTVPSYSLGPVTVPATTYSKTVSGPRLSSFLVGPRLRASYSAAAVAGRGIALTMAVKEPGTRVQAALSQGHVVYAFTRRATVGSSGHLTFVLRASAGTLQYLLGAGRRKRLTLALRFAPPGTQEFEIDRPVTITR